MELMSASPYCPCRLILSCISSSIVRGLRRSCRPPGPGAWRCGGKGGGPGSENGEMWGEVKERGRRRGTGQAD